MCTMVYSSPLFSTKRIVCVLKRNVSMRRLFWANKHTSARKIAIQLQYALFFRQNVCSVCSKETSPWDAPLKQTEDNSAWKSTRTSQIHTLTSNKVILKNSLFTRTHHALCAQEKVSSGHPLKHPKLVHDNKNIKRSTIWLNESQWSL